MEGNNIKNVSYSIKQQRQNSKSQWKSIGNLMVRKIAIVRRVTGDRLISSGYTLSVKTRMLRSNTCGCPGSQWFPVQEKPGKRLRQELTQSPWGRSRQPVRLEPNERKDNMYHIIFLNIITSHKISWRWGIEKLLFSVFKLTILKCKKWQADNK